ARDPAASAPVKSRVTLGATLRALLGVGSFLILVLYFTLQGMPGWAVKNWLPTHLAAAFGLRQGPAGLSATGYVTVAAFFGTLIGGWLGDQWGRLTLLGRGCFSASGVLLLVLS